MYVFVWVQVILLLLLYRYNNWVLHEVEVITPSSNIILTVKFDHFIDTNETNGKNDTDTHLMSFISICQLLKEL